MKPICVPCRRFYRPKKNGHYFTEGMPTGNYAPPGNEAPDLWRPYKLWVGDLWRCEGCGAEIIVGVANQPLDEHYHDGFHEHARRLGADKFQVNDC